MKVSRFTAPTMGEALRQVKAKLGPEAVILETAEAPGQVTVTAAVDLEASAPEPSGPAAGDAGLVREVRELMGLVRALVYEPGADVQRLHRALVEQGVDGVIAAALVRETAERLAAGASLDAALAGTLPAADAESAARVRLFVGPPGDGKTTTLVKVAAQARRAGQRVALIGADTWRIGAAAEIERYGRALQATVLHAKAPAELGRALARAKDADLVLVDTAGAGPGQRSEFAELAALVDAAGPDAGRTLVVSAATGSVAGNETCRAYAALAPDRCVLTKIDTAPGGPMLALLWHGGIPVSHLATGRRIPDDLEPATPERLARCLLAA
jgi:flagellar biosynthesis protein FlhF